MMTVTFMVPNSEKTDIFGACVGTSSEFCKKIKSPYLENCASD